MEDTRVHSPDKISNVEVIIHDGIIIPSTACFIPLPSEGEATANEEDGSLCEIICYTKVPEHASVLLRVKTSYLLEHNSTINFTDPNVVEGRLVFAKGDAYSFGCENDNSTPLLAIDVKTIQISPNTVPIPGEILEKHNLQPELINVASNGNTFLINESHKEEDVVRGNLNSSDLTIPSNEEVYSHDDSLLTEKALDSLNDQMETVVSNTNNTPEVSQVIEDIQRETIQIEEIGNIVVHFQQDEVYEEKGEHHTQLVNERETQQVATLDAQNEVADEKAEQEGAHSEDAQAKGTLQKNIPQLSETLQEVRHTEDLQPKDTQQEEKRTEDSISHETLQEEDSQPEKTPQEALTEPMPEITPTTLQIEAERDLSVIPSNDNKDENIQEEAITERKTVDISRIDDNYEENYPPFNADNSTENREEQEAHNMMVESVDMQMQVECTEPGRIIVESETEINFEPLAGEDAQRQSTITIDHSLDVALSFQTDTISTEEATDNNALIISERDRMILEEETLEDAPVYSPEVDKHSENEMPGSYKDTNIHEEQHTESQTKSSPLNLSNTAAEQIEPQQEIPLVHPTDTAPLLFNIRPESDIQESYQGTNVSIQIEHMESQRQFPPFGQFLPSMQLPVEHNELREVVAPIHDRFNPLPLYDEITGMNMPGSYRITTTPLQDEDIESQRTLPPLEHLHPSMRPTEEQVEHRESNTPLHTTSNPPLFSDEQGPVTEAENEERPPKRPRVEEASSSPHFTTTTHRRRRRRAIQEIPFIGPLFLRRSPRLMNKKRPQYYPPTRRIRNKRRVQNRQPI